VNELELSEIQEVEFVLRPRLDGRCLLLTLSGSADGQVESVLAQFFRCLHAEALRLGVREVIVDMHRLEFMNSSCFKGFIVWIDAASSSHVLDRYRIRLRSNASFHWQARSLDALRRMAPSIIDIECIEEALP